MVKTGEENIRDLALTSGERRVIVVEELFRVERPETLQYAVTNASRPERADDLALQIIRIAGNVGHLPLAALDHLTGGHEVADEQEDVHHDLLSDGDDV